MRTMAPAMATYSDGIAIRWTKRSGRNTDGTESESNSGSVTAFDN